MSCFNTCKAEKGTAMIAAMAIAACMLFLPHASRAGNGGQLVTAADLEPLYRSAILQNAPWPRGSIEITEVKAYPPKVQVPKGNISYEAGKISSSRYLGRVAMEITIRVNDVAVRTVRVCGRVEAYRNVLCAARDLRRGDIIRTSSLTTARMPVSKIRNQMIDSPSDVIGMAVKHSIRAGQPFTINMVAPPVLVRRGARVTILAQSPTITIRVPGRAVEPGAAGDFIRVKNLQSRKEILAQVRDSRTVTVMF